MRGSTWDPVLRSIAPDPEELSFTVYLPSVHTLENCAPITWNGMEQLIPSFITQIRIRLPACAVRGCASYWNARPLNTAISGTIRTIFWVSAPFPLLPRYISPPTRTYSLSTRGRPSCGSMTTAPYIPPAICTVIGAVEQWYIHMPARDARNV